MAAAAIIIKAIRERRVLKFTYHGTLRVVEPQACGISTAGHAVLRGYQRSGGSRSRQPTGLKLYDIAKISDLQLTEEPFSGAQPGHNPEDSAMAEVHAALPLPPPSGRGRRAMTAWIGTSGFQYPEWRGTFYPEKMPPAKMLPFYADRFSTTEINYSFRRIPSAGTIEKWADLTPSSFRFSLKAPQKVTHWSKLRGTADTVDYFFSVVSALGPKLGAVLFQLPPHFPKDVPLLREFLAGLPRAMRPAFEFRHPSWFHDEVFAALRAGNAALCVAESRDLKTPFAATADFGYLRLRREDYTRPQLARWARQISEQKGSWTDAFVYFKHEEQGIGPAFAKQMMDFLQLPDK